MTLTPPTTTPTHHRALVATVFTLQFLVALDMSLVNIALPAMRADLGFTASGLQWVVNAYLLTFAGSCSSAAGSAISGAAGPSSSPGSRCSPSRA